MNMVTSLFIKKQNKLSLDNGKMRLCKIFLFLTLLMISASAFSVNYYVGANATGDQSGRDINNLTTLTYVNRYMNAGDTAYLVDTQGDFRERIDPIRSGTSDSNRIRYIAYQGQNPVINLGDRITGWTRYSGTDGIDAIYRKQYGTETSPMLLVIDSFEEKGRNAILWNLRLPNLSINSNGSWTNRERKTCTRPTCMNYPGDHTLRDGYTYVRTYENDDPDNHEIIAISDNKLGVRIINREYITVSGIDIKYASKFVDIKNSQNIIIENGTYEYSYGYDSVDAQDSSFIIYRNLTVKGSGSIPGHTGNAIGLINSSNSLIENNDVSYFGHAGISVRDSRQSIVRNNKIHSGFGKNIILRGWSADLIVIEHNISKDSPTANEMVHQHWADHGSIVLGADNTIVRFNQFWGNSMGMTLTPIFGPSSGRVVDQQRIYHNISHGNAPTKFQEQSGGIAFTAENYSNVFVVNNILSENYAGTISGDRLTESELLPSQIGFPNIDILTAIDPIIENNILWTSGDISKVFWKMPLETFEILYRSMAKNNLDSNPLFKNPRNYNDPDWSLRENSPAIDAGRFLTTTSGSYSGNTVRVRDSRYFVNGFGVVEGDKIKIGSNPLVTVLDVNYDTHIITHNGNISGPDNQGVSFEYTGRAPDIGVFEYDLDGSNLSQPEAPTNTQVTF